MCLGLDDRSRGPFTPRVIASTAAVTDARPATVYAARASRTNDERLTFRLRASSHTRAQQAAGENNGLKRITKGKQGITKAIVLRGGKVRCLTDNVWVFCC